MGEINKTNTYTEFYYHFFRNILLIALPLFVISALVLSLPHSSASGVDTLTLTLSSSCTMSSVVDIEHNGSLTSGTYIQNIGQTTVKTLCNDGNGYAVYANGYSNNEEGNNRLINTEYPQYSIDTGLATSGLISNWAMKLNNIPDDPSPTPPTIESDYNNTYGIVPPYWTKVASRASGTTDMTQGSSFTTTYAVYASSSQYAGTYQGQVKYLLTHPNINKPIFNNDFEIAFLKNGKQIAYQDENGPYFAMQDMTTDICNSVTRDGETTAIQLVDVRDNKLYWIAKLKDGHCWMTQNLDFDINANATLNSADTDLNVAYDSDTGDYREYLDGYTESNGIIYYTPTSSATTIDFTGTTVTGWQNSNATPYTANKTDSTETGHASLGNYYNWTAAIASNNSNTLTSAVAINSICPAGWRLFNASRDDDQYNEFGGLLYDYYIINDPTGTPSIYQNNGFVALQNSPLYFVLGGFINDSGLVINKGVYGSYYSSVAYSINNAYAPLFDQPRGVWTGYDSGGGNIRGRGRSIRCVAR